MKPKTRKGLSCILILSILISIFSLHVLAADNIASGYCGGEGDGTNLEWFFDEEGTLTITGTGAMADYESGGAPWYSKHHYIEKIVIGENVTNIGSYAFHYCSILQFLEIPNSVTSIDEYAFNVCYNLKTVTIGNSVTAIGKQAFGTCDRLQNVCFYGDAPSVTGTSSFLNSFPTYVTIHYIPCASGWTDSEEYDATTGKWNGYKLTVWTDKIDATGHCIAETVIENEKAATCKREGSYDEVVYCDVCKIELSRETKYTDKLTTHTAADPVQENEVPATCKDYGSYDEVTYCAVCELELSRVSHTTDKLLTHTSSEPIRENEIAATCKEQGSYDEVVYCAVCEIELSRVSHSTEKTSTHTPTEAVQENKKAATCEQEGSYDEVIYCDVCEIELSRETKTTEKADCQPGAWIIDREATPWREGSKHKECINCGAVLETETIPATHWGGSSGNRDPFPKDDDEEFDGNENPFYDIGKNNWFYKDVLFVYLNGLMNGVSNGEFDPHGETTRAMVITILWRLAGKPIVNSDVVFVDVPNNQWYTDAIRWAASEGIVGGVGGSKFAPDGFITREQLATMLYRYEAYANGKTETNNETAFADHANVSSWAQDAVSWCSGNGIVNGKGENQFAPKDSSTRAELAAMLHRYIER